MNNTQVWGETNYTWSEDFSACTAKRVDNQDNAETAEAQVTHEQTQAPTDDKAGTMTHVATFSVDWAETDTKTSEIPKLEHQHKWGKASGLPTAAAVPQSVSARMTTPMWRLPRPL